MIDRATLALFFAAVLQVASFTLTADSVPDVSGAASNPEPVEPETEIGPRAPFDPALVGLQGLPNALETQEDFNLAIELVDGRIAQINASHLESTQAETQTDESGPGAVVEGDDPRITSLQALRLAVQRGAAYAARLRELDAALASQQDQLDNLPTNGLGIDPPFPVSLLDQLRTERGLTEHFEDMVEQRRDQAERQVEHAEKELAVAMRERRQARDRWTGAEDPGARRTLELELAIARIGTLVALQERDNALAQQTLVQKEAALAAAQLALLEAKIEFVREDVIFTQEALQSRLAEVKSREASILANIEALISKGEAAEVALVEARQRLQQMSPEMNQAALQEQVHAREDELAIARKSVDYQGQVVTIAKLAQTLLERRYMVLQELEEDQWAPWLRETQTFLKEVNKDQDFTLSELSALRSMELALSRRLSAPDLDQSIRESIRERVAAIEVQSELAEEMLLVQDQMRSLAHRLRMDLEPRVHERSFGQRLEQAQDYLAGWWDTEIAVIQDYGIHVRDVVTALGVFIFVFAIVWFLQLLLRRSLLPSLIGSAEQEQDRRTLRVVVSALIRHTSQLFVLAVAFYAAMAVSGLGQGKLQEWLWTLLVLAFYLQIGIWANAGVVDYFKRKRSRKERDDPSAVSGYGLLLFFLRVGIWIVVGVSVLAYFKYPIAGLIGALGVGGIAVAFAVQNILADVFNSMAIILDKPFRVGDFINAGETLGVIEHIGVKTTRIRSLSGEQVVMSNTDLLNSRIHNYKHMRERRVVFKIRVVYETPPEKLERIPLIIAEIIRAQQSSRFDRAHFVEYGDFSLLFEVVYYVIGADYNLYMNIQQAINLNIYRRFQETGIRFAYPTQEVIVRRTPEQPERIN